MARIDNQTSSDKKVPGVNIAGDYSVGGADIAPDDQAPLAPADAEHMRQQRERVKQGGLVNPSSDKNANTDWPVDQ